MADLTSLSEFEGLNVPEIISNYLGVSLTTAIIILVLVSIWALVWKGWGLWKSGRNKKIVWFIAILISQTYGILEIPYIFLFSKIKNDQSFRKINDGLLIISVIFALLSIWNITFLIFLVAFLAFFSFSLLQISVDRKEWVWLVLGIVLIPIVPIIYYFVKIRKRPETKHRKK